MNHPECPCCGFDLRHVYEAENDRLRKQVSMILRIDSIAVGIFCGLGYILGANW